MWTNFISQTAEERAKLEGEEGTERLLVSFVEGSVAETRRAFKEASKSNGELSME